MAVIDLDILRPEEKIIVLNGNQIDVSFVPLGITFDLDEILSKMGKITAEQVQADQGVMREAFDYALDMCVLFCKRKYPEMTKEWFLENVNAEQVNALSSEIKETLVRSYQGVDKYQKNVQATKKN